MLSFHAQLKVFVATAPCDLRMNFNGLWTAAQQHLGEDPKSGALFVFGNRHHNRIKILYFDGTGVYVRLFQSFSEKMGMQAFCRANDCMASCSQIPCRARNCRSGRRLAQTGNSIPYYWEQRQTRAVASALS